ncbi:MAG: hypothetical protein FJ308_09695, partial [Planctomycetes bacterium]|nr:hypothetical protein [Planctomycetota bacterium]
MTYAVLVPGAVLNCLDESSLKHRGLWLANWTDVSLTGQPSREWLTISSEEISTVSIRRNSDPSAHASDNPLSGTLMRSVPWTSIRAIRTQSGVGGGTLQIRVEEDWVDILRFSNAHTTRFHKISRLMEKMREAPENWQDSLHEASSSAHLGQDDATFDPPECPTCSLRLTTREESCPRCVQKGQILRRVHDLLRPYRSGAILLCLLTFVGVVAELIPPKLQQYMIDNVLAGHV